MRLNGRNPYNDQEMSSFRLFLSAALAGVLGAACAGGTLGRISKNDALPTDLPKELQDKFTVRDSSSPGPSASPTPSPTPDSKKKGRKKGKKTPQAVASEAPFVIPSRRPAHDPILVDEEHVFSISYLGIPAAQFSATVLPYKMVGDRKVYHLRGTLVSLSVFNMIYRLNDQMESYVDYDGLFSHRYHLVQTSQTQV